MNRSKFLQMLAVLMVVVFSSCEQEENFSDSNKGHKVADETVIVNQNMSKKLVKVEDNKLIFKDDSLIHEKISAGNILISDISEKAPNGYLRKIVKAEKVNGQVELTTQNVALTEALDNYSVSYSRAFTDEDILSVEDFTGGKKKSIEAFSFSRSIEMIILDTDWNHATTDDQVVLSGKFDIKPEFDFDLNIENKSVKRFKAAIRLNNKNTLTLRSDVKFHGSQDYLLWRIQLKPFTIPGPVPIPIAKQWIDIRIGIGGSIEGQLFIEVENNNTLEAGTVYEHGRWKSIHEEDVDLKTNRLIIKAEAKVAPSLGVNWELNPFGLESNQIFIGIRQGLPTKATIDSNGSLNIDFAWRSTFNAKASVNAFGKTLLDFNKELFDFTYPIKSYSIPLSYPQSVAEE